MRITWFGHAAFRVEFAGKVILFDPFFTGNPAFRGDVQAASKGATHILLTHGHGDHVGDTLAIAEATGAKIIGNYELCAWLASKGLKNYDDMNTGGTVQQDGFSVTMVQAFHSSGDVIDGVAHAFGPPGGLILKPDNGPSIYHLGDTAIFSDMKLINDLYRPKIGFVPIGDRYTMGGRVAAYACREFFDFELVVPCHYASFPIIDQTADLFLDGMKDVAGTRVLVPEVGKQFEV